MHRYPNNLVNDILRDDGKNKLKLSKLFYETKIYFKDKKL